MSSAGSQRVVIAHQHIFHIGGVDVAVNDHRKGPR